MSTVLTERLKAVSADELRAWAGEGAFARGAGYVDRIRLCAVVGERLAGVVRGTETYTTNVFFDEAGGIQSLCTCPVGRKCKHAVALVLAARKQLADGAPIAVASDPERLFVGEADLKQWVRESRAAPRSSPDPAPPPPPPPAKRYRVAENPFGRWKPDGTPRAYRYSFRVVTPDGVFHWSMVVGSLMYALAKRGLDFVEARQYDEAHDPAAFTCSCGDVHCGGFGDQRFTVDGANVVWRVEYGDVVELEFDRVRYEHGLLSMLSEMRRVPWLRKDPWSSVASRADFQLALAALLSSSPRLSQMWSEICAGRPFSEDDFARFAAMDDARAPASVSWSDFIHASDRLGRRFDVGLDRRAENEIIERCKAMKIEDGSLFIYGLVVGQRWQNAEIRAGDDLTFVREPDNAYDPNAIRVDRASGGGAVGYLSRKTSRWLSPMMARHGVELRGHVEEIDRVGKGLPVRIDLAFGDPREASLDWGESVPVGNRLAFEMLRTVCLNRARYSIEAVEGGLSVLQSVADRSGNVPEVAFLYALVTAGMEERKARQTREAVARRKARFQAMRAALGCSPAGGLLDYGSLRILPLRAEKGAPMTTVSQALAAGRIAQSHRQGGEQWGRELFVFDTDEPVLGVAGTEVKMTEGTLYCCFGDCVMTRSDTRATKGTNLSVQKVSPWRTNFVDGQERPLPNVPALPEDATGYAVFWGEELVSVRLYGSRAAAMDATGELKSLDWHIGNGAPVASAEAAFGKVADALANLPILEGKDGEPPRLWRQGGVHDGGYLFTDDNRLIALRLVMMTAHEKWND